MPFETVFKDFAGRDDAIEWMEDNQLGRRNLKPDAFTYLLGRKYNRQKKSQGGDRGNQYVAKDQNDTLPTADKLAVQHGVSAPTVKRAAKLKETSPEAFEMVKAGDVSVPLASQFTELPHEVQQEAIAAIAEQNEPAKDVMTLSSGLSTTNLAVAT